MELPVQTKKDVIERLKRSTGTLHNLGVERLALFGSFTHGDVRDDSDVDVLVDFAPGKKTSIIS